MKNKKLMVVYNGKDLHFRNKIFLVPENFRTQNFVELLGKTAETKFLQVFQTSDTTIMDMVSKHGHYSFDENIEHPDFQEHVGLMVKLISPRFPLKNRVTTIKKCFLNGDVLLSDGLRISSMHVEKFNVKLKNYALQCIEEKGFYTDNASNNLVEFFYVYGKNNSIKFTSSDNYFQSFLIDNEQSTGNVNVIVLCQGVFPNGDFLLSNSNRVKRQNYSILERTKINRKEMLKDIKKQGHYVFIGETFSDLTKHIFLKEGTGKSDAVTKLVASGVYGLSDQPFLTESENKIIADAVDRVKQYTKEDLQKALSEHPLNIPLLEEIVANFDWVNLSKEFKVDEQITSLGVDIPVMMLRVLTQQVFGNEQIKYNIFPRFVVVGFEPYTNHVFRIVEDVNTDKDEPSFKLNNGMILYERQFKNLEISDIKNKKIADQFSDLMSLHALALEEINKKGYFYIGNEKDLSIRETQLNEIFIEYSGVREWYDNGEQLYFILSDRILVPNENYASTKWGIEGTEHQHGFIEYSSFTNISLFSDSTRNHIDIVLKGGGVFKLKFKKGDKDRSKSFYEKLKTISNEYKKNIFIEEEIEKLVEIGYKIIAWNNRDYIFLSDRDLMILNSESKDYFSSMLVDTVFMLNDTHIEFLDNYNTRNYFFETNFMRISENIVFEEIFNTTKELAIENKAKEAKEKLDKRRKELIYKENKVEKVFECVDDTLFVVSDGILFLNTTEKLSFSDIGGVFCAVNGEFNNSLILGVGKNVLEIETKKTDEETQEFTEYLLLTIEKYLEVTGQLEHKSKPLIAEKYDGEINRLDLTNNKKLILFSDWLVMKDCFTGETELEEKSTDLNSWEYDTISKILTIRFKNDTWRLDIKPNCQTKRSKFLHDFSQSMITKNENILLDKFRKEKNIWGSFELTEDIIFYNTDTVFFYQKNLRTGLASNTPKQTKLNYFSFNLGNLEKVDIRKNLLTGDRILVVSFKEKNPKDSKTIEIHVDKNTIEGDFNRFINGLAHAYHTYCKEKNLTEAQKITEISLKYDVKTAYNFGDDLILFSGKNIVFFDKKENSNNPREILYERFELAELKNYDLRMDNETYVIIFDFGQNKIFVRYNPNMFEKDFYVNFSNDLEYAKLNVLTNSKLKCDFIIAVDTYKRNNHVIDSFELENGVLLVSESYASTFIISEKTDSVDKATYYFSTTSFPTKIGMQMGSNSKFPVTLVAKTNENVEEIGKIGNNDFTKLKQLHQNFVEKSNKLKFQENKLKVLKHELGSVDNFLVDVETKKSNIIVSNEKVLILSMNILDKDYEFNFTVFKRDYIFKADKDYTTISLFFNNFSVVLYFDSSEQCTEVYEQLKFNKLITKNN